MRFTTSIMIAGLLGLSSTAFAATPAELSTREARMAEALKNYESQKAVMSSKPQAGSTKVATPHKAAKQHRAVKHGAKR